MNSRKIVLAVFAGCVLLSSCRCQRNSERLDSADENRRVVRRVVDEAWNSGNVAVIDELLSPDYVLHIPSREEGVDREGYRVAINMYRAALSEFRLAIDEMIVNEDRVITRWTISGTHRGPYMGLTPTDKPITLAGISIRRIEGGKIAEEWVASDMLGLMQQMGAVPVPGQGGQ